MKPSFKHRAINSLITLIIKGIKKLELHQRRWLTEKLATLILATSSKTRTRAIANIKRAFSNLSNKEARALAVSSYQNIVYGVFESFWLDEIETHFDIDDDAKMLLLSGEPLSVATMHMNCYEMVPFALQNLTDRSTTLSNIPEFLLCADEVYTKHGIRYFNKKNGKSFIQLLGAIRSNKVVSLHSDHFSNDTQVEFFNQMTGAPTGVAMLSAIGRTPVLLAYAVAERSNRYRVCIETISMQPVEKSPIALQNIMQKVYHRFEDIITEHPDQWYWSYNRWRKAKC